MTRLKRFVLEIHRRTLWQILAVYVGASWFVLEVTEHVRERFLMPEWVYGTAFTVLLIGLPFLIASALVRDDGASLSRDMEPAAEPEAGAPAPVALEPVESTRQAGDGVVGSLVRRLTWGRAALGVVAALALVGLIGSLVVIRGAGRVTEAYGAAGGVFEERAWLVVAEFEAAEEERDVAQAARTALMIDLNQSQYVNVFGDNQLSPVLRRMMLPDTIALDVPLSLELAEREGLAAVLSGSVDRLGGDVVLSARVIEPGTGAELLGVRTAASSDRLLDGVERLSHEIRRRLGETRSALRKSLPLPRVTTGSLEGLKKYALAVAANSRESNPEKALELAEEAILHDSSFAAAYRLAAVANRNAGKWSAAAPYAARAYELRDRLTDRERLLIEADYHWYALLNARECANAYELLLAQYPDDPVANHNLAVMAGSWLHEPERAYSAAMKSVELDPYSVISYDNAISYAQDVDRWGVADSLIDLAWERGFEDAAVRNSRSQAVGLGHWERTEALCDSLLAQPSTPVRTEDDQRACGYIDLARGRVRQAMERFSAAASQAIPSGSRTRILRTHYALATAEAARGQPDAAAAYLEQVLEYFPAESLGGVDRHITRETTRSLAALLGLVEVAERVAGTYPTIQGRLDATYGELVGDGTAALARGDAELALETLNKLKTIDFRPSPWEPFRQLAFGLVFAELGEADSAIAHLEAVIRPSEIADTWIGLGQLPAIERRLAELEESRGNTEAAIRHYQRFLELWSDADPELAYQVRDVERALASLSGMERS